MATTVTVESLQAINNFNVAKYASLACLIADASAPTISNVFDPTTGGILASSIPSGYYKTGAIGTNGFAHNRSLSASKVMSANQSAPARNDVDSDDYQLQVQFQEVSKLPVAALNAGLSIADALTITGSAGAPYTMDKRIDGAQPYRRILILGHDIKNDIISGIFMPLASVTAYGARSQQRSNEDMLDVTFDCSVDPVYGTDVRWMQGGAGLVTSANAEQTLGDLPIPAWKASTAYSVGQSVTVTGGTLQATVAGTSGSTAPTAPASVGGTVVDGTVTWKRTA